MSTAELINTGILMGIIHVLTGPDHLSALATLTGTNINQNKTKNQSEAFFLGIRWGIGHSIGLILVGGLLIAVKQEEGGWIYVDPIFTTLMEGFVGMFMLALGTYGLYKADKNNREGQGGRRRRRATKDSRSVDSKDVADDRSYCSGGSSRDLDLSECEDIAGAMEDVLGTDSRSSMHDLHDELSLALSADDYLRDMMDANKSVGEHPSDMTMVTIPMKPGETSSSSNKRKETNQPIPRNVVQKVLSATENNATKTTKDRPPMAILSASDLMNKHTEENTILSGSSRLNMASFTRLFMCDTTSGNNSCARTLGNKYLFKSTPGLLALLAGLVHGIAGPGGVLGVVPAVQLRDPHLASIYLGTFCVTSTVCMGGFAAFYGTLSKWLATGGGAVGSRKGRSGSERRAKGSPGNRIFMVEVGSALLSVCVGCIWLILLTLGELEEIFP